MANIHVTARRLLDALRSCAALGITSATCLAPDADLKALCVALASHAPACLMSRAPGYEPHNALTLTVYIDGVNVTLSVHNPAPPCFTATYNAVEWCEAVDRAGDELMRLAASIAEQHADLVGAATVRAAS